MRVATPRPAKRWIARAAAGEAQPEAPKAAPKAKPKPKTLPESINEDVIPALKEALRETTSDLQLDFEDNQLCGTFVSMKNQAAYNFWAFFPDGTLEGQRGFAVSAYGQPPSIVEPFMVDEKRITPELVVFWIAKRLKAQKSPLVGTN